LHTRYLFDGSAALFSVIAPENGLLHDANRLFYAFSAGGRRTNGAI